MRKERKHYTAEEKVAILRRHLLDKVPLSDLCEELGLQPTVFDRWQKEFFENGAAAFQGQGRPDHHSGSKVSVNDDAVRFVFAYSYLCGPVAHTFSVESIALVSEIPP